MWDQTFLVWEGEDKRERRSLTYGEFDREVSRLAQGLSDLGIVRRDIVAIYMPNLPETFIAFCLDITKSLAYHGFRKILLVNGHGSNTPLIDLSELTEHDARSE